MIALAALALAAGEAAPRRLDPLLGRPYRLTIEEERSVSGALHHFTAERRLTFGRDGDLLVVEVVLVAVGEDVGGAAGRRFRAAAGALRGRPVRLRLGTDGGLRSIDDEAAVWALMAAGVRAAAEPGDDGLAPGAMRAFVAVPPDARRAIIASTVLPAIAGADAALAAGEHPVVLPSRGAVGAAPLRGWQRVTIADGRLRVVTHADGAGDGKAVSVERERTIDPARGLVLREEETQTTRLGDAAQVTRKRTVLTAPVF